MTSARTDRFGKRAARKQDRRAAIVSIATRRFMEQGYSAVSMSAIASELGGSKGTLWSYFSSKEELFDATISEVTRIYQEQVTQLLAPSDDLHATLSAFTRSLLAKITSKETLQLHRMMHAEAERAPEFAETLFRRGAQRTRELLASFLADAMEVGQLRGCDPMRAALVLTSLCMGVQERAMASHLFSERDINHETGNVVDLFFRAFSPESVSA